MKELTQEDGKNRMLEIGDVLSRNVPHISGGTVKETYAEDILGKCKCGKPVTLTIGSNITYLKNKNRYWHPDEIEGAGCLFRCYGCKEIIEQTFTPIK